MRSNKRMEGLLGALALAAGVALIAASVGVSGNASRGSDARKFTTFEAIFDTVSTRRSRTRSRAEGDVVPDAPHVPASARQGRWQARARPGGGDAQDLEQRQVYTFGGAGNPLLERQALRATDFEATIKRNFLANGQGVGFYTNIVGAERSPRSRGAISRASRRTTPGAPSRSGSCSRAATSSRSSRCSSPHRFRPARHPRTSPRGTCPRRVCTTSSTTRRTRTSR